jgi:hypothetical protein
VKSSFAERFAAGMEPENIDKEFLRLWFRDNCDPYKDETLPGAPLVQPAEHLSVQVKCVFGELRGSCSCWFGLAEASPTHSLSPNSKPHPPTPSPPTIYDAQRRPTSW